MPDLPWQTLYSAALSETDPIKLTGRIEAAHVIVATNGASGFSVAGTVTNVPEGVRLTVTLAGSSGTFRAIVDPSGAFSIGGVPAGDYDAAYEWVSTDGTATQVGKLGAVSITGDRDVSFGLP
jgi:hypothetical protein